jgi:hypothetical protein
VLSVGILNLRIIFLILQISLHRIVETGNVDVFRCAGPVAARLLSLTGGRDAQSDRARPRDNQPNKLPSRFEVAGRHDPE